MFRLCEFASIGTARSIITAKRYRFLTVAPRITDTKYYMARFINMFERRNIVSTIFAIALRVQENPCMNMACMGMAF